MNRRRSLPLLFLSVQLYNVAGFFVSIVPSLIYQVGTYALEEAAFETALLRPSPLRGWME